MKNVTIFFSCLVIISCLSGCGLMEDAFKAGVIFALIIIAIVGLIIWLSRIVIRLILKKYDIILGEEPDNILNHQ